jgi:hypothetical protein
VEPVYILLLLGATSGALYLVATRRLGLARPALAPALGRALELVGLTLGIAAVNVAAGFLAVLAIRWLSGEFFSLYLNTDSTLLPLSAVQAAVLQRWMEGAERD